MGFLCSKECQDKQDIDYQIEVENSQNNNIKQYFASGMQNLKTQKNKMFVSRIFQADFHQQIQGPILLNGVCLIYPDLTKSTITPKVSILAGQRDKRNHDIGMFAYPNNIKIQKLPIKNANTRIRSILNQDCTATFKKTSLFCWKSSRSSINKLQKQINPYNDIFLICFQFQDFYIDSQKSQIIIFSSKLVFITHFPHLHFLTSFYSNIMKSAKQSRINKYQQNCNLQQIDYQFFRSQLKQLACNFAQQFSNKRCSLGQLIIFKYKKLTSVTDQWNFYLNNLQKKQDIIAQFLGKWLSIICKKLPFDCLIKLLSAIILEKNILLVSQQMSYLTFTSLFLRILINPAQYAGSWIFITPKALQDCCLQSPIPMIFGCLKCKQLTPQILNNQNRNLNIYDIDKPCNSKWKDFTICDLFYDLKSQYLQLSKFDQKQINTGQHNLLSALLVKKNQIWKQIYRKTHSDHHSQWTTKLMQTQLYQLLDLQQKK